MPKHKGDESGGEDSAKAGAKRQKRKQVKDESSSDEYDSTIFNPAEIQKLNQMRAATVVPEAKEVSEEPDTGDDTNDSLDRMSKSQLIARVRQQEEDIRDLGAAYEKKKTATLNLQAAQKKEQTAAKATEQRLQEQIETQQTSSNVAIYTLINASIKNNSFLSGLQAAVLDAIVDGKQPKNLNEAKTRLADTEALCQSVRETSSTTAAAMANDLYASFFQLTGLKRAPLLLPTLPLDDFQYISVFRPDRFPKKELEDYAQEIWTKRADSHHFLRRSATDFKDIEAPITGRDSIVEAKFALGKVVAKAMREGMIATIEPSDTAAGPSNTAAGASGEAAKSSTKGPGTSARPFTLDERSAKNLAGWQGYAPDIQYKVKKNGKVEDASAEHTRMVVEVPPTDWVLAFQLPLSATSQPEYVGMMPPWMCGACHFLGQYLMAGDKLTCAGCGCSKHLLIKKGVQNFKFFLPSQTFEIFPAAEGVIWVPDERADPKRKNTHNQKATKAYQDMKQKLIDQGKRGTSSDADFREGILQQVRKQLIQDEKLTIQGQRQRQGEKLKTEEGVTVGPPNPGKNSQASSAQPLISREQAFQPLEFHWPEYDANREMPQTSTEFQPPEGFNVFQVNQLKIRLGLDPTVKIDSKTYPFRLTGRFVQHTDPEHDLLETPFTEEQFQLARQAERLVQQGYKRSGVFAHFNKKKREVTRYSPPTGIKPVLSYPSDPSFYLLHPAIQQRLHESQLLQRASIQKINSLTRYEKIGLLGLCYTATWICLDQDPDALVHQFPVPLIWYCVALDVALFGLSTGRDILDRQSYREELTAFYEVKASWTPSKRCTWLLLGASLMAKKPTFWTAEEIMLKNIPPEPYTSIYHNAPEHPEIYSPVASRQDRQDTPTTEDEESEAEDVPPPKKPKTTAATPAKPLETPAERPAKKGAGEAPTKVAVGAKKAAGASGGGSSGGAPAGKKAAGVPAPNHQQGKKSTRTVARYELSD